MGDFEMARVKRAVRKSPYLRGGSIRPVDKKGRLYLPTPAFTRCVVQVQVVDDNTLVLRQVAKMPVEEWEEGWPADVPLVDREAGKAGRRLLAEWPKAWRDVDKLGRVVLPGGFAHAHVDVSVDEAGVLTIRRVAMVVIGGKK